MAQQVYTVQRKWRDYNGGEVGSSPVEIFVKRETAILKYKQVIGEIMLDWEDFDEDREVKFERRTYYFEVYDQNDGIYDLVELCEKDLIE